MIRCHHYEVVFFQKESVKRPVLAEKRVQQFITLGLNKYEACAYLALVNHAESSAVEVADRAGVPRQRIYDVLESLHERSLIEIKEGRPIRYTGREQRAALNALLDARLRQQKIENELLARLVEDMIADMEPSYTDAVKLDGDGSRGGL